MAMPAVQNAVLGSVNVVEIGKAVGVFNMGRLIGGMFGIACCSCAFPANGAPIRGEIQCGFTAAMARCRAALKGKGEH